VGNNELKYRQRFTTSIDKNILKAFFELAKVKNQPKSWLIDEALEDLLGKNGITVERANDPHGLQGDSTRFIVKVFPQK
jgi:predicted transcriptional regulator